VYKRQAVGITQQTDAIAVVVSEETGKVSVAIGGKLVSNLNEDELKDLLLKELGLRKEH
jgi:diadenylate cyclase